MAKVALGRLGWSEEQALKADVNSILLAWEGRQEADDELYRVIYTANGVKLPEKPDPNAKATMGERLLSFARSHNDRWKTRGKARAGQAASHKGKVEAQDEQG